MRRTASGLRPSCPRRPAGCGPRRLDQPEEQAGEGGFPQPDSPTIAKVSPRRTSRSTPSTARTSGDVENSSRLPPKCRTRTRRFDERAAAHAAAPAWASMGALSRPRDVPRRRPPAGRLRAAAGVGEGAACREAAAVRPAGRRGNSRPEWRRGVLTSPAIEEASPSGRWCRDAADRRRCGPSAPVSTMRPAVHHRHVVAISATTPRSCVTRSTAAPASR